MSKKKNKFKKSKKRHSPQQNINTPSRPQTEVSNAIDSRELEENREIQADNVDQEADDFYGTDKYNHVKKDVVKILIIMAAIVLVIVAVYILNSKTTIFTSFGDWVYKILNIQTS